MSDLFPFQSEDSDDDIYEEGGGTISDPCVDDLVINDLPDIDQPECCDDEITEQGEPHEESDVAVERLEYIFDKAGVLAALLNDDEVYLEDD